MKIFLTTSLKMGFFFGLWMGIFYAYSYGLNAGIKGGIFCGVAFGFLMGLFAFYRSRKFTNERPPFVDEKLIKEGSATHYTDAKAVGGWIYLTDKRLIFKSHSANIRTQELSIPLSDIENADKSWSFLPFQNRLQLKLKNGKVEKFLVEELGDWIKNITALN